MKRPSRRVAVAATTAALALAALAGPATSVTSTVTLAEVSGSRTLTVTDAAGTSLDAAALSTGAGASVPFVTTITDVLYDNLSYDVDASMSNLYLVDAGSGNGYACDVFIPADDLSISWPTEAFGVSDIEALLADVLFDVSGTLPSTGTALLDGVLSAAGVPVGTGVVGTDLRRSGQGLVETIAGTATVQSLLEGVDLPLSIGVGAASAFDAAADHSVCGGGAPTPTAVNLQSGDPNERFGLATVAGTLEAALGDVGGVVAAGHLTRSEVLDGILTDAQLTSIQTQVASLGLESVWDAYVDTLLASLELDDVSITTLVGQSGSYTSVPSLDVAPTLTPAGTGTPPVGMANLYRGEMVITLTSS